MGKGDGEESGGGGGDCLEEDKWDRMNGLRCRILSIGGQCRESEYWKREGKHVSIEWGALG